MLARSLYRQSLDMSERLFRREEFPNGHTLLISAYSGWANVLLREGQCDLAASYLDKALSVATQQFPVAAFPEGHDELAKIWRDIGALELACGRYEAANTYVNMALDSYRKRYSHSFPDGQLAIADTLSELGRVASAEGRLGEAEDFHQQSLSLRRRLFSSERFPFGHPGLSISLSDLGDVYAMSGRYDEAFECYAQSVRMEHAVASCFVGGNAESLLLNLAARRFQTLSCLLESWKQSDRPVEDAYDVIWLRRGFVPRTVAKSYRWLRKLEQTTPTLSMRELFESRREMSRSLLCSTGDTSKALLPSLVSEHMTDVRRTKSSLRAEKLQTKVEDIHPRQMAALLAEDAVFIDFVRYIQPNSYLLRLGKKKAEAARVLGFVISHGRKIACVDLGDADRIEGLVLRWRDEILAGRDDGTGQELRELVWDPISELFPEGTRTVYVAPDGALSLVAWGALPTGDTGHLLLEDYAIATVPHGQFLAEQLRRESPRRNPAAQQILAVGDVHYGVRTNDALVRQLGIKQMQWQPLQASADEVAAVSAAAADRHCMVLTGAAATPSAVLERLPHSRWAHFATHGFFVDPLLEKKLNLTTEMPAEEKLSVHRSRHTVLARSPFIRSGLALAGANELGELDELGVPKCTKGILTAEEIAASDCSSMELVVLSACETGRGDMAHGDGVFSIQTAFHVAGARNVIGTLWKIDDRATAQLMGTFYRLLWEDGRTPLDALRTAQLQAIHAARKQPMDLRGPDLSGTVSLTAGTARRAPTAANNIRTWAAFVLSGPGF